MIKKQAHCPRVVGPPKSFILTNIKTIFICYKSIKNGFNFTPRFFIHNVKFITQNTRAQKSAYHSCSKHFLSEYISGI